MNDALRVRRPQRLDQERTSSKNQVQHFFMSRAVLPSDGTEGVASRMHVIWVQHGIGELKARLPVD